jgi:hypothetical protein
MGLALHLSRLQQRNRLNAVTDASPSRMQQLTHHGCQPLPPRSAMPSADPCPLAADGTPRVRTLVFRGWAGATGQP